MIAIGALVLLVITIIAINLSATGVLFGLGYRPEGSLVGGLDSVKTVLAVVRLVSVVALAGVGTASQVSHEWTVNQVVNAERAEHSELEAITVRIEYGALSAFTGPETVTVVASHTGEGDPPGGVAADIEERIDERTDRQVGVQMRFQEHQTT